MSSGVIQFTTSLLTPLLVAVVTAVLTVQLSFRRFQAERWWDRKADAYSPIIEAPHHLVAYTTMTYERWTEEANFSEDYKREMEECSGKAFKELRIATGIGAYVISDEAAKILSELDARPAHENPYDQIEGDLSEYQRR